MSRYTAKMLQQDIAGINRKLAGSGASYYFKVRPRNGCAAVDLCAYDAAGKDTCIHLIAMGSPRECALEVHKRYLNYLRCIRASSRYTLRMARAVISANLDIAGIIASGQIGGETLELVNVWAGKCKSTLCAIDFIKKLQGL